MERKIWTEEQDRALKDIIEVKRIQKWSAVSRAMDVEYNIPGRTGKQCRERWHNQLDPKFTNQNWTKQQQQILFNTHNVVGNRWAKISALLPGRTDNYIKNHFYSTLRKAVRRVNNFLTDYKDREFRQIKTVLLNKILACAEDNSDVVQISLEIKNKLIPFANLTDLDQNNERQFKKLIELVIKFTDIYKRKKPKKKKKKIDIMQEQFEEQVLAKKQETGRETRTRISRHSLINDAPIMTPSVHTTQKIQPLFSMVNPLPSIPIITNTPIQTDSIPDYIRVKLMTNHDTIFDSPMPGITTSKFFDSDASRLFFPNPLSLQASAGPNLLSSNAYKAYIQNSTTIHRNNSHIQPHLQF